ncbi:hypothetical protein CY34DRAFT_510361 [Suillus luteus UH-Slu-Lm8-n1]|uniref:Uncharacterized protein n=1 Tax=Suillus luteus UH-Slu-Lm8-n1 TaxID=930992 RepID=A0A0D0A4K0_9AGAM|nr:hypothetical protein CY34DRAFT_510361 [Suillus luteus UH-Slu-Lm8-n1]
MIYPRWWSLVLEATNARTQCHSWRSICSPQRVNEAKSNIYIVTIWSRLLWCFAWISLRYKNGVRLPRGSRPFDECAKLDDMTCYTKKLCFLAYPETPERPHIDPLLWRFIIGCFHFLDMDYFYRRNPQHRLSKERGESQPTPRKRNQISMVFYSDSRIPRVGLRSANLFPSLHCDVFYLLH